MSSRILSAVLFASATLTLLGCTPLHAQMGDMQAGDSSKPLPSPPATASVTLAGQTVMIKYNAPSMRGREIFGGLVPYDQVWRTGANPATTLITPVPLHIGLLLVPAGTYTMYTLPGRKKWMLIVNKQTGQWGTVYNGDQDLGRAEMKAHDVTTPQEVMSIYFDDIKRDSAMLHVRWALTDETIKVTTP